MTFPLFVLPFAAARGAEILGEGMRGIHDIKNAWKQFGDDRDMEEALNATDGSLVSVRKYLADKGKDLPTQNAMFREMFGTDVTARNAVDRNRSIYGDDMAQVFTENPAVARIASTMPENFPQMFGNQESLKETVRSNKAGEAETTRYHDIQNEISRDDKLEPSAGALRTRVDPRTGETVREIYNRYASTWEPYSRALEDAGPANARKAWDEVGAMNRFRDGNQNPADMALYNMGADQQAKTKSNVARMYNANDMNAIDEATASKMNETVSKALDYMEAGYRPDVAEAMAYSEVNGRAKLSEVPPFKPTMIGSGNLRNAASKVKDAAVFGVPPEMHMESLTEKGYNPIQARQVMKQAGIPVPPITKEEVRVLRQSNMSVEQIRKELEALEGK